MALVSDIQNLKAEMARLIAPDNKKNYIFRFVLFMLNRYNLSGYWEVFDILTEAYSRAHKKIEKGESIQNLEAWLRTTSLNIIKELYSKEKTQNKIRKRMDVKSFLIFMEDIIEFSTDENLKALRIAFSKLSQSDLDLLYLRHVSNLRWPEISQMEGHIARSDCLRQRGRRALEILRKEFNYVISSKRFT